MKLWVMENFWFSPTEIPMLLLAIFVGPDSWHYIRHLWDVRPES